MKKKILISPTDAKEVFDLLDEQKHQEAISKLNELFKVNVKPNQIGRGIYNIDTIRKHLSHCVKEHDIDKTTRQMIDIAYSKDSDQTKRRVMQNIIQKYPYKKEECVTIHCKNGKKIEGYLQNNINNHAYIRVNGEIQKIAHKSIGQIIKYHTKSMTPNRCGRSTWTMIHTMLRGLKCETPDLLNEQQVEDCKDLIYILARNYPASQCRVHFNRMLNDHPVPDSNSKKVWERYVCKLHNLVNKKLNKPQYKESMLIKNYTLTKS